MDLTAVKMILAGVMLCSGFVHFTFANRLRIFNVTEMPPMTWRKSLEFCTNNTEFLVTLYDEGDINFMRTFNSNVKNGLYVGLYQSNQTSRWSDGTPYICNLSTVRVTNGEPVCEGIDKDSWKGFNCSERMYFMCYKGNNYHLIKTHKTWCQAQLHCRKYYTDLVNITNEDQNKTVIQEGQNETFWIGLIHDGGLEWADQSCSTYRQSLQTKSHTKMCSTLNPTFQMIECDRTRDAEPIFCSKGRVRIVVINENKTWEEAFDYCENHYSSLLQIEDEQDEMAVKQWLSNNNSNADLFWIALRQSRVFGFWIWRDRTVSNNNWKDGKIPEMPLSNNCGVISRTDFTWRDENCWHKLPFLCEEEILLS